MQHQDQLNRIEEKLDRYAQQTSSNSADLAWLKRFVGAVATLLTTGIAYLLKKHG